NYAVSLRGALAVLRGEMRAIVRSASFTARIGKYSCHVGIEENHVGAFRVPFRGDTADRFGEIILRPHCIFVGRRVSRRLRCLSLIFLNIAFAHSSVQFEILHDLIAVANSFSAATVRSNARRSSSLNLFLYFPPRAL